MILSFFAAFSVFYVLKVTNDIMLHYLFLDDDRLPPHSDL